MAADESRPNGSCRGSCGGWIAAVRFVLPTWRAWAIVTLAHWLPSPFDWIMTRFKPARSRDRATATRTGE